MSIGTKSQIGTSANKDSCRYIYSFSIYGQKSGRKRTEERKKGRKKWGERDWGKKSEGMKVFSKIINTELIRSEFLDRGEIL